MLRRPPSNARPSTRQGVCFLPASGESDGRRGSSIVLLPLTTDRESRPQPNERLRHRPAKKSSSGGRTWWAHLQFIRISRWEKLGRGGVRAIGAFNAVPCSVRSIWLQAQRVDERR